MTTTKRAHTPLEQGVPERRYLPELHGVRGLALLGVVIFHLFGDGRTSGGIDIFLAVSGFLFTGMLLREATASGGQINLFKYFGRLIRRIFVPAAIVAIATLILGLLISPATQHRQLWAEAQASLLYFENFELINSQLAYGAAGPDTSPFQHFWSLSVQGQFYLLWPFVAIIAVLLAKATKTSAARIMALLAGTLLVLSLAYAIYVGSFNQDEAYLMTSTRLWQLSFGALLALAGSTIRLPRPIRGIAGWVGIGMIASCGFILDGAQLFPGPWALWPLIGLTLVLTSSGPQGSQNDPSWTASRFLSNKPLAWIGDHAYGLYLWHWPLLIFYMEIRERDAVGVRGALVILAITVILAMLMYRYIEEPLQGVTKRANSGTAHSRNKTTVVAGVGVIVIIGTVTSIATPKPPELNATYKGLNESVYPGASQFFSDDPLPEADVFPSLENATQYTPAYTADGCGQKMGNDPGTDEVTVCEDDNAPENPSATIVLAGGSHAGHLEGAFKALGQKYGWEVLIVTKSSCVFGWEEKPDQEMCGQWNENFIDWLEENEADLVITPSTRLDQPEYILDAAPTWWEKISETDTDLLLVRGTPRGGTNIPECLASGNSIQDCGPSKENYADTSPVQELLLPDNIHTVDMTRYVCPQIDNDAVENCDAIVGNILVWYDNHHFTSPFSQSLAPGFEAELREATPSLVQ